jgi:hypothetical protein
VIHTVLHGECPTTDTTHRRAAMPFITQVVIRGLDPETYDKVRAEVGWLDSSPDGGFAHLAWFEDGDNHNIDVWESEAAFAAFGEQRLGPALAKLGVTAQPEVTFHPAHEVFLPAARTVTVT